MAFISEIHYRTGDVTTSDPSTHEFVEITLGPGEDPADFVLGFYGNDGDLMDNPGDNIQATGVVNGEVTLSSLTGVPDPQNSGYTIYTITSTSPVYELINASPSQVTDEANYIALTNTATNTVVNAIGVGRNGPTTLSGGAGDGATTTNAATVGAGQSVQFDYLGNNISGARTPDDAVVPCFCAGTRISVPGGTVRVEDLSVGDQVTTQDNGPQHIRWIGRKALDRAQLAANPKLRPIQISQGALGLGLPRVDLHVSRQHRMLACSPIVERMFDQSTSLVAAVRLTDLPGIFVDESADTVTYFHILFDRHEIIFAEGAPTESLYLGEIALEAIGPDAHEEISALFPDLLADWHHHGPATVIPSNKRQKDLAALHVRNAVPLLDARSLP